MTTTAAASILHPQGPFSLDRTREFVHAWPPLARYAPVDDEPLRLGTVLDGQHTPVVLALTQARPDGPVAVEVAGTTRTDVAVRQAARMLSLDHDARGNPDLVRRDPALGTVMARRPGLRPTLFGSPYEAACWAVISARMPVTRAGAVLADLGDAHGATLEVAGGHVTCFPDPATLLGLDAVPGLSAENVRRLHDVAEATLAGRLEADDLRAQGSEGARAALQELPPRSSDQPGGSRRSAPDPVGAWCLEGVEPGGRDEGRGAVAHPDVPVAVVMLVMVVGAEQDQIQRALLVVPPLTRHLGVGRWVTYWRVAPVGTRGRARGEGTDESTGLLGRGYRPRPRRPRGVAGRVGLGSARGARAPASALPPPSGDGDVRPMWRVHRPPRPRR